MRVSGHLRNMVVPGGVPLNTIQTQLFSVRVPETGGTSETTKISSKMVTNPMVAVSLENKNVTIKEHPQSQKLTSISAGRDNYRGVKYQNWGGVCPSQHIRRGPAQDVPFFYTPSHLSELQSFKSIISTNISSVFIFKYCTTFFRH